MTLRFLDSFKACYKRLPADIQLRVDRTLQILRTDPRHPSLRTKKMKGPTNVWEARVTLNYHLTFHWESGQIVLRRAGTRDILKKESS